MKLSDKINFAFKDLMNRKLRSILTIIAVSVGSLLLILMLGLGDGIINKVKDMFTSYGDINLIQVNPVDSEKSKNALSDSGITVSTGNEDENSEISESEDKPKDDYFKKISDEDVEKIQSFDGIDKVSAVIDAKATGLQVEGKDAVERNINVTGISFKYDYKSSSLVEGSDMEDENNDILISENLTKRLGFEDNSDLIGKKIDIIVQTPQMEGIVAKEPLRVQGTIKGVLDRDKNSDTVIMSDKKANAIAGYFTGDTDYLSVKGYSMLGVYAKDGVNVGTLSQKITNECGYTTMSMSMIFDSLDSMGSVIKGILSVGGIIVLIVAALGLVNTVSMTLQEKRKMIGVMRSIGGSRSNIRIIFMFQSIMLGVAGGILGAVLSSGIIVFINNFVTKTNNFKVSLAGNNVFVAVGITFIIAVIAGLIPASKAAKLNVVEAVAEE